jgi:hypothetical protein
VEEAQHPQAPTIQIGVLATGLRRWCCSFGGQLEWFTGLAKNHSMLQALLIVKPIN